MAGAILLGLGVPAAVEFSFLLGLVTLGAATIYEGVKAGPQIIAMFGWVAPAVGLVTAAVAAFIAVKWMVGYLRTRSLEIFGWYRLGHRRDHRAPDLREGRVASPPDGLACQVGRSGPPTGPA